MNLSTCCSLIYHATACRNYSKTENTAEAIKAYGVLKSAGSYRGFCIMVYYNYMWGKQKYDFIAIGDTVTDAFIKLKDAHVNLNRSVREICMRFGDKIPYEEVYVVPAVGNAANAASSAARLGLKTAFVSNVGEDDFGKEIINVLDQEGIDTKFIKVHPGKKTNYHYVLWYGDDRTILIKHHEYDYKLPDIGNPRWIYFSSMGENSLEFHRQFEKYLQEHPDIKLAFQPGTYQIKFGKEKLAGLYRRSEVFFCNKEEAERILNTKGQEPKKLLLAIHTLGPKTVVITDGVKGAYAYDGSKSFTTNGGSFWFMPLYPDPKPPLQRTGAGDAFSSTFTAALVLGKDIREALRWGPVNSMSVVQKIGARAGLLTREELENYLKVAPENYQPKLL